MELFVNSPSIIISPESFDIVPLFSPPFTVNVPLLSTVPAFVNSSTETAPLLVNLSSSVLKVNEPCSNESFMVTSALTLFPSSSV